MEQLVPAHQVDTPSRSTQARQGGLGGIAKQVQPAQDVACVKRGEWHVMLLQGSPRPGFWESMCVADLMPRKDCPLAGPTMAATECKPGATLTPQKNYAT